MAAAAERLPADVLGAIRRRLPIVEYLRFPAVCTAWRSAAGDQENIPHLPRGPPWLFDIHITTIYGIDCLSDIGSPKVYMIPLPDHLHGCGLVSSVGHRLLLENWGSHSGIHLFNPFSSSSSTLPPFIHPSLFEIKTVVTDTNSGIAFALPSRSPRRCCAAYIRLDCDGDSINPVGSWVDLSPLISDPEDTPFTTAVVYKPGLFVAADHTGNKVVSFDFSTAPAVRLVDLTFNLPNNNGLMPDPDVWCTYRSASLVNSGSSLFLVRWASMSRQDGADRRRAIDVYRLDDDASAEQWVPVRSLGDRSFFIGSHHSISLSAVDFPELKSNRVYLPVDPVPPFPGDFHDLGRNPVYNLEDESWGVLHEGRFLIPSRLLAPSVWMIPRSVETSAAAVSRSETIAEATISPAEGSNLETARGILAAAQLNLMYLLMSVVVLLVSLFVVCLFPPE